MQKIMLIAPLLILAFLEPAKAEYFDRSELDALFTRASEVVGSMSLSQGNFSSAPPPGDIVSGTSAQEEATCSSAVDVDSVRQNVQRLGQDQPQMATTVRELSVTADALYHEALFEGLDAGCPVPMRRRYGAAMRDLDALDPQRNMDGIEEMAICLRDLSRDWRATFAAAEADGDLGAQARASSVLTRIADVDIVVNGARREFGFLVAKTGQLRETLAQVQSFCGFE